MRNKLAVVSYEYGTLAIEVRLFLTSPSSFLQRISVSAKYRQINNEIYVTTAKLKDKHNIDRQCPRLIPINSLLPDPSYFSLYITFKSKL
jgi:hypothetical protein